MQIDTVLFDLDNTLLNRRFSFSVYAERFANQFLHIESEEEQKRIVQFITESDRDGYRKKKELYEETLSSNVRFREPIPTIEVLMEYWFSQFALCSVLMDGAIEILEYLKLKNMKLGLITNGTAHLQGSKLDFVGIRHFFDVIVISDEVGIKKPEVGIFELALRSLEAKAENCVYVGDQPKNDIEGAERAGMTGIWLEGFKDWNIKEFEPRYRIKALRELQEIL